MEILGKIIAGFIGVAGITASIYFTVELIKEIKESGWELENILIILILVILLGLSLILIIFSLGGDIPSDGSTNIDSYNLINWMTWWIIFK